MKRLRLILKILLATSLLLAMLVLAAGLFPRQILTVESGPVQADVLVVLGGDEPVRAERAAELFKAGEAPQVICSGYGDAAANRAFMVNAGVPAKDITLEAKSHNTRENAELSIPLIRKLGARRVIIVTSWYHSRRALACFEHNAPDIQFYSRPTVPGDAGRSEDGTRQAKWADWKLAEGNA